MSDPVIATVATSAIAKSAIDRLAGFITSNVSAFTKPIRDRAVVQLGLGMNAYLEASYNRCRFFKSILNQATPLEVTKYYTHTTLSYDRDNIHDDDLISRISEYKHIVITGLAGSGKSMFMKYLTVSKFENTAGSVPIFVELRSLNNITKRDLIEYIRASCITKGHDVTREQFALALTSGAFTLILDGFDELNHDYRQEISEQILQLCRKYPEAPIIVSSRPDERFGSWSSFHVFSVKEMSKSQCLSLIDSLEYDSGVKKRFYKEVKDRLFYSHRSFLSSPLLTTIMLLTFEEFAEIPVRMHAFYSQAFDTLFQKHDASKEQFQRKTHTGLTKEDFRSCFAAFCAMSYLNQRFSFTDEQLVKTADSALDYLKQSNSQIPKSVSAGHFISDLKESVCLLQRDGTETSFVHRSFQEYFAALFATSLSGEKMKKILDRYSVRYTDSVITMVVDMARERVEQSWVIPTLDMMEKTLFLKDKDTSISSRFSVIFRSILYYKIGNSFFRPASNSTIDDVLGPFEIICCMYSNRLGDGHFAKYLSISGDQLDDILSQGRNSDYGFELFEKLKSLPDVTEFDEIEFDLREDNDWWLKILGAERTFSDIAKAIPAIRRDISQREKKREIILQDFM